MLVFVRCGVALQTFGAVMSPLKNIWFGLGTLGLSRRAKGFNLPGGDVAESLLMTAAEFIWLFISLLKAPFWKKKNFFLKEMHPQYVVRKVKNESLYFVDGNMSIALSYQHKQPSWN